MTPERVNAHAARWRAGTRGCRCLKQPMGWGGETQRERQVGLGCSRGRERERERPHGECGHFVDSVLAVFVLEPEAEKWRCWALSRQAGTFKANSPRLLDFSSNSRQEA
ncbi:hypothetical protein chiPu_0027201 [Chiloscyllium punctatum]|uniref:Uncharacterized protein n=1 Tax=Chiloscyllium punctatum TaxID=137246 RepID=A0A401TJT2_CHIPU|nr:hypothetical protein [Chiloscyllium punctatum]